MIGAPSGFKSRGGAAGQQLRSHNSISIKEIGENTVKIRPTTAVPLRQNIQSKQFLIKNKQNHDKMLHLDGLIKDLEEQLEDLQAVNHKLRSALLKRAKK